MTNDQFFFKEIAEKNAKTRVLSKVTTAVNFRGSVYSDSTEDATLLGFSWVEADKFLEDL